MKRGWKLGQLGEKKKPHRNKRNFSRCKNQGKDGRRETIIRDMRSAEKALQAPKSGKIHLLLLGQGKFPKEGTKGSVWCLPSAFAELECLGKRQSCGNGAGTEKKQQGVPEMCDSHML